MRRTWIVWFASLALLLAACADEEPEVAEEPPPEVAEEDEEEAEEPTGDATVATAETDLGPALVDAEGLSLYLFEMDADGESTCYDDCAETWPPLISDAPSSPDADVQALLGTHTRDDGESQVTYNDWPLYTFAGDNAPGDTAGQGVGDAWWLVDPAGEPIHDAGP